MWAIFRNVDILKIALFPYLSLLCINSAAAESKQVAGTSFLNLVCISLDALSCYHNQSILIIIPIMTTKIVTTKKTLI